MLRALTFVLAASCAALSVHAEDGKTVKTDLYTVVDGTKVDSETIKGFRVYREVCAMCHGPNQEGAVGPSLVNSLKTLTKDDFVKTVTNGRPGTQMVAQSGNAKVMANLNQLYSYIKGRSDGAITQSRVTEIGQ